MPWDHALSHIILTNIVQGMPLNPSSSGRSRRPRSCRCPRWQSCGKGQPPAPSLSSLQSQGCPFLLSPGPHAAAVWWAERHGTQPAQAWALITSVTFSVPYPLSLEWRGSVPQVTTQSCYVWDPAGTSHRSPPQTWARQQTGPHEAAQGLHLAHRFLSSAKMFKNILWKLVLNLYKSEVSHKKFGCLPSFNKEDSPETLDPHGNHGAVSPWRPCSHLACFPDISSTCLALWPFGFMTHGKREMAQNAKLQAKTVITEFQASTIPWYLLRR